MCAEFMPPFPSKAHNRLNMRTVASPGVLVTHIECPHPSPAGGCSFRGFYVLRDSPTGITSTSTSWIFFSTVSQSWAKEVFVTPAVCPRIGRRFGAGGVSASVNHPGRRGQGAPRARLHRATQQGEQRRSAKTTFTHPHPTSTGVRWTTFKPAISLT